MWIMIMHLLLAPTMGIFYRIRGGGIIPQKHLSSTQLRRCFFSFPLPIIIGLLLTAPLWEILISILILHATITFGHGTLLSNGREVTAANTKAEDKSHFPYTNILGKFDWENLSFSQRQGYCFKAWAILGFLRHCYIIPLIFSTSYVILFYSLFGLLHFYLYELGWKYIYPKTNTDPTGWNEIFIGMYMYLTFIPFYYLA